MITVTDSKTPVIEESWLDPEALVVALGSYRELPDETVRSADTLVVDHLEQCLERGALSDLAERGALTPADVDTTIGEFLAAGSRTPADERVVFVPIGLGSIDVALAEHLRTGRMGDDDVRKFEFL